MTEEKMAQTKSAMCTWTQQHPHLVISGLVILALAVGFWLGTEVGDHRYKRFGDDRGYGKMMDRGDMKNAKDFQQCGKQQGENMMRDDAQTPQASAPIQAEQNVEIKVPETAITIQETQTGARAQ